MGAYIERSTRIQEKHVALNETILKPFIVCSRTILLAARSQCLFSLFLFKISATLDLETINEWSTNVVFKKRWRESNNFTSFQRHHNRPWKSFDGTRSRALASPFYLRLTIWPCQEQHRPLIVFVQRIAIDGSTLQRRIG